MSSDKDYKFRQTLAEARLQADSSEDERRFLASAEMGDIEQLKELLESGSVGVEIVNLSGRTALELAVDANNVEIVEYLLPKCSKETVHRALLCAVENDRNFIFDLILQHPMYSEKTEVPTTSDTVDDTGKPYQNGKDTEEIVGEADGPSEVSTLLREALVLAAIECNFAIVRTLVFKKAFIERPHDYFCMCTPCSTQKSEDMMQYTKQRLSTFKALASPAHISVTEKDPIMAAFQLSFQFKKLSEIEIEYKQTYLDLDQQCQQFAIDLIAQCRSSVEVSKVLSGQTKDLDGDGDDDTDDEDDILPLLKIAMRLDQKKFVAHPSCQAQVAQLWFSGVPALRYLNRFGYLMASIPLGIIFVPILSIIYLVAPWSKATHILNTPIMRFVSFTCSYLAFLICVMVAKLNVGMSMDVIGCDNMSKTQQFAFMFLIFWTCGLIWEESKQIYEEGGKDYFSSFWNIMDTAMLSLFMCTFLLEVVAPRALRKVYDAQYRGVGEPGYCDQLREEYFICDSPLKQKQPILVWEPTWVPDPSLLSDITFSIAVLMSIGRISFVMPSNEQFGTMLVSFRRTTGDIFNLFSMFILVLLAFSCGMAVLYGGETCSNEHFNSLSTTSKTLIWAMFGMGDSEYAYVDQHEGDSAGYILRANITANIGSILFGVFVFATAVVLMNLLIAMMANTFQEIQDDRDVEWKFGRTELWLNFIAPGSPVPPPFNIIPSTKSILNACLSLQEKCCSRAVKIEKKSLEKFLRQPAEYEGFGNENESPESRQDVLTTLVKRYVRKMERERMEEDEDSMKDEMLRRALDRVTAKLEKRLDYLDEEVSIVNKGLVDVQTQHESIKAELRRLGEAQGITPPPAT